MLFIKHSPIFSDYFTFTTWNNMYVLWLWLSLQLISEPVSSCLLECTTWSCCSNWKYKNHLKQSGMSFQCCGGYLCLHHMARRVMLLETLEFYVTVMWLMVRGLLQDSRLTFLISISVQYVAVSTTCHKYSVLTHVNLSSLVIKSLGAG
jgi:hypothetical protein